MLVRTKERQAATHRDPGQEPSDPSSRPCKEGGGAQHMHGRDQQTDHESGGQRKP